MVVPGLFEGLLVLLIVLVLLAILDRLVGRISIFDPDIKNLIHIIFIIIGVFYTLGFLLSILGVIPHVGIYRIGG